MEDNDNLFKITCQRCSFFVTCKYRSGELLLTTFIHDGLSNIGLYPEFIDPENFFLQWIDRTKMQRMYQKFLKEVNGNHKF